MARLKSENRRNLILNTSKSLFSQKGYFNTSISDIVKECGLPVGSIYTYFASKEEIVRTIVEEGWQDVIDRLISQLKQAKTPQNKLKLILKRFLPELMEDADLIDILLSEAISLTRIEEKIQVLLDLIIKIIKEAGAPDVDTKYMKTALIVYFLGILNFVRLSRAGAIDLGSKELYKFLQETIQTSMGIKI